MDDYLIKASELSSRNRAYTFDDVLLVPVRSSVRSRFEVDVTTQWTKRFKIKLPIIAANMDTVSEAEMCVAMNRIHAGAILHRFMTVEDQVDQVRRIQKALQSEDKIIAASIGVTEDARPRAKALVSAGVQIMTVDIAHGHSDAMIEMVTYLKKEFSEIDVIAGNVATRRGAEDLIRAGADAIKVGIGPGSMCTTRVITGVGMPQLTAIAVCAQVGMKEGVPVIADGGIRASGDAMKALAAGAQSIMAGSLLAGCVEAPGETVHGKKLYRGMASRMAQESWRGGILPEGMAPEGESRMIPCKGFVREVVLELVGGIRSGMSYLNCKHLDDLKEFATFVEVSPNCLRENMAHGLLKSEG